MPDFLDNPVYNALITGNADKACGTETVKYFDKEISPFAGFNDHLADGFNELYQLLPEGRKILYAKREEIPVPPHWSLLNYVAGSQFLYHSVKAFLEDFSAVTPLNADHVKEMIDLAMLTKPGPFNSRTIEFGNYHGVFHKGQLIAMTGRRLHINNFIEVSAVCTHPEFNGNGYACLLLKHQINSILEQNMIPFLHVRSDNKRAIDLYERLGFILNGPMHFYFLRK